MPSRFAAVTNKEISQLIKEVVPEIHKEGLNLSIKPVKKFFVYKCKFSLSLGLLYLVDLFINKLKTKFNNPFYRMILNRKRINNSFLKNVPARAKKMPSKVLFVGKKKLRPQPFGHCAPKL